ncbi:metal ABC transporter permease [Corynebacterium sp.]|uniref:metal ABC transporter permease n=1 Tax=Corynebacterium sp. TaxID=1720 RepID=UPI002A90E056|nr:metal ABC transporter permease [Corynebacterium sp.]MDY5786279.1 metal ABC transporter permease [Corynebacterium sp.]
MSWWHLNAFALWEVVLVGAATGLIGAYALMHRRIFFAEAVSHATFPGAVLGVVVGAAVAPDHITELLFAGALLGCALLSAAMAGLARMRGMTSQSAAGIVLSAGFGLGYFAATWFKPLPVHVDSFLTGSVLTANATDVAAAGIVLAAAVLVEWWAGPRIVALGFSRELYIAQGRSLTLYDATVLTLICLGIVVAIPAVGTIVSIALLAAPAAILRPWVRSPSALVWAAPVVGVLLGVGGLLTAEVWGLSAGGMIALWAGVVFAGSSVARHLT